VKAIKGRQDWKSAQHKDFRGTLNGKYNENEIEGDVIHATILDFVEGFNPVGPSIHTFKLAMLNKKMMTIIM